MSIYKSVLDLEKGESGYISRIDNPIFTCKFYTLGIMPSSFLELVRWSPFKDACYVRLGRSLVALRKEEARSIILKV